MTSDILLALTTTAESFLWIFSQKLSGDSLIIWVKWRNHVETFCNIEFTHSFANILRFFAQALWIWNIMICNCCKQFLFILAIEWWLSNEHLFHWDECEKWRMRLKLKMYVQFNVQQCWSRYEKIYFLVAAASKLTSYKRTP